MELRDEDAGGTWDLEAPAGQPSPGDGAWEAHGLGERGGCCAVWRR